MVAILGSTYTGEYEPIAAIHDAVAEVNDRNGWEVPIHVDAASGGFVAPFLEPDLNWDFRLPLVKSINVSGHKYGLVYPGIGWVVWRDRADLPEDLIFHISYLGGDEATFNLNFSKGASQVIAQYYNFLRLGREGYRRIMTNLDFALQHSRRGVLSPVLCPSFAGSSERMWRLRKQSLPPHNRCTIPHFGASRDPGLYPARKCLPGFSV